MGLKKSGRVSTLFVPTRSVAAYDIEIINTKITFFS